MRPLGSFRAHRSRRTFAGANLEEIWEYLHRCDGPERVGYVLERIEVVFNRLAEYLGRGNYPAELQDIGIREYREVFFRPYRRR